MRAFVFGVLIAIAGCAPAADEPAAQAAPAPAPVASSAPAPAAQPAPVSQSEPASQSAPAPEPARRVPKELLTQGGVNYECSVPADCAVKDVGNCCGYYPACVNKDSPTFPEQVKAQCKKEGISSVCGFQDIAGCDCIEGRCTARPGAGGTASDVRKD